MVSSSPSSSLTPGRPSGTKRSAMSRPSMMTVAVACAESSTRFTTNSAWRPPSVAWMRSPDRLPSSMPRMKPGRSGEIARIDDEPVGEADELLEVRCIERRRSGPPEEHRQVRQQQRDDRARDPVVDVAAGSDQDVLAAHLLAPAGPAGPAVHL